MLNIYVTSPNHKDGKTLVTAGLAATMQSLGYSTAVYKPIQTNGIERQGFAQSPDLTFVKTIDPYINTNCTYIFKTAAEPLIAAEQENQFIDINLLNREYQRINNTSECTIIDGDGGIFSPLAPDIQTIDMIKNFQTPVIFVVTPNKDTINDILLSIYASQEKGISVCGVIINNIKEDCPKSLLNSIPRVIEEYTNVEVLGLLPNLGEKYSPEDLISSVLNGIDIESVFKVKIEKLGMPQ